MLNQQFFLDSSENWGTGQPVAPKIGKTGEYRESWSIRAETQDQKPMQKPVPGQEKLQL